MGVGGLTDGGGGGRKGLERERENGAVVLSLTTKFTHELQGPPFLSVSTNRPFFSN